MGVYIKGLEMPNSCLFCPLNSMKQCRITGGDITWATATQNRRQDCPLVPVPPHYDLIDHNALKIAVMNGDCETRIDFLKHTMDCINKAPVVIPSDMQTYEDEEGE